MQSEPKPEPKSEKGKATRIIHNRRHKDSLGSPYSPVYNTTTYRFADTASLQDVIEGRTPGNLYTRQPCLLMDGTALSASVIFMAVRKNC